MPVQVYDDEFFYAERSRLLAADADVTAGRRFRLPAAIHQGAAHHVAPDPNTLRALGKLAPRHARAARAHMAFYQASLQGTALVPAHELVQAAVQIEWLWYSTPFKDFYRDHLAHVLKVTTIALHALEEPGGILGGLVRGDEKPGEVLCQRLADGKVGAPVLRQAARRLGVTRAELKDPAFWRAALHETLKIAGLLHDMAYPAMLSGYLRRAAGAADPIFPFANDHEAATLKTLELIDGTLVGAVFAADRSDFIDVRPLLRHVEHILQKSHSLQAGANLLHYRRKADHTWRLSPREAFAIEWAARAATLHDFDKVWEYAPGKKNAGKSSLTEWLKDPEQLKAIRPSFEADPASYLLAFADQVQDFGRLNYHRSKVSQDDASLVLRYPCRSVDFEKIGNGARLTWRFGPHQKPFGVEKAAEAAEVERKQKDAKAIFGPGGWLDHSGIYEEVLIG